MEILVVIVSVIASLGAATVPWFLARYRRMASRVRSLEEKIEEVTDRNWELRDTAERARSLLQAQGDLIVRRNAEGIVTYANDSFCALASPYANIVGADFALPVIDEREPILLPDGTRIRDQRIASADGERWISWREVTVRDPRTDRAETQSVGRDVTARIQTERALAEARDQAEAASRAKSRFLAAMSHEIRTPLNGILGMADLLTDTPLTAEQRTYAGAVKSSGLTLLSLIEDVLDFSKIEAGKLTLVPRPFALGALVEEIVELIATRAQAKDLEIGSYVDDRLPQCVIGDAGRLRQVLLNLAGNAVKFTETGGVCISVLTAEPGYITFRIRDTGLGIPVDAQERIFAEFEQAQPSARRPGGTGLGLSISQRIVQHMDGHIRVESRPGEGACFYFSVPLPAEPGTFPISAHAPNLSGNQVLIVSGSVVAPLLGQQLEAWDVRVRLEPDASAALALCGAQAWDAVIADRALTLDSLRRLAAAAPPEAKRIVLLAPGERRDLPIMNAFGFGQYLIKPVRSASLAAMLSAQAAEPDAVNPAADRDETAATSAPLLKVLVAEDNEINALLVRSLLEKLGHRAVFASDGAQALELWRQANTTPAPFDFVLMDVQMPVLDGLEAARRIRAAEAAAGSGHVPIIALSANALAEDREECLAAGMDDFLIKPLDRDKLGVCLARHSRGARVAA